jgi:hypothetical protein
LRCGYTLSFEQTLPVALIAIEALGPHQIENLGTVEQARKARVVFGLGHAGRS